MRCERHARQWEHDAVLFRRSTLPVVVPPVGMTMKDLSFDTGIR
jgi:hypothetical protein